MTNVFNISNTKSNFERVLKRVQAGEEIIIARRGKPIARIVPVVHKPEPRKPGFLKGKIWIGENFDAPLPEYMMRAFRSEGDCEPK